MARKTKSQIEKEANNKKLLYKVIAVFTIFVIIVGIFNWGVIGIFINNIFKYLLGDAAFIFMIVISLWIILYVLGASKYFTDKKVGIALTLFFLSGVLISAINTPVSENPLSLISDYLGNTFAMFKGETSFSSGLIGTILFAVSNLLFGVYGTLLLIIVLILVAVVLLLHKETIIMFFAGIKEFFTKDKSTNKSFKMPEAITDNDTISGRLIDVDEKADVILERAKPLKNSYLNNDIKESVEKSPVRLKRKGSEPIDYVLPPMSLLKNPIINRGNENNEAAIKKGKFLIEILANFGIDAELVDTHIGPSVTKFEIKPAVGVKVSKISNLADDIKMALAAKDVRIEAPIPGYNTVGVEIPNVKNTSVMVKEIVASNNSDNMLTIGLGKDLQGKSVYM
ncbi:MAG: DNA translocase FtsK, partial [Erysipelotrichaceae bacterium]